MPCELSRIASSLHGGTPPNRAAIRPGSCQAARVIRQSRRPHCRAITLIELLVVLALLVVIGSMVTPVFTGSFANIRLRRAGDQLIASWSQARKLAIETGVVYQFRFTPESGEYRIEPWLGETLPSGVAGATTTASGAASTASAASATSSPSSSTTSSTSSSTVADDEETPTALPTDVTFYAGQLAAADPLTQERRVDAMVERGGEESTPILFYPDGTTSEAAVVLTNDRKEYVRVALRSLTGVGRTSSAMTSEELQRWNARNR